MAFHVRGSCLFNHSNRHHMRRWQQPSPHIRMLVSQTHFAAEVAEATDKLLIVKFFAEDCYACKTLTPVSDWSQSWAYGIAAPMHPCNHPEPSPSSHARVAEAAQTR